MEIKVQEKLTLKADYEKVFNFFAQPEVVLKCIPGAEFKGFNEDGSFKALAKVKLGAINLSFEGNMVFEEKDPEKGKIVLKGQGKDKKGAGGVKTKIEIEISKAEEGVEVQVNSSTDVTGKVIQYGRGMFQQIAKQIFGQFVKCSKEFLEGNKEAPEDQELKASSLIVGSIKSAIADRFKRNKDKEN